jgi:hypothetical protein
MKKACYILGLITIVVVSIEVLNAFGLLESQTTRVVQNRLGKWTILVNNTDVTASVIDFNINSINYETTSTVQSGKLAPGLGGYFDISIDPTDTEVSIRYDITYDTSALEEIGTSLNITGVSEISNKQIVRTDEHTYTGIISLSDIADERVDTIRTVIGWPNDETKNEQDSELGKTADTTVEIPVQVTLTQYTGEQIVEYVEE